MKQSGLEAPAGKGQRLWPLLPVVLMLIVIGLHQVNVRNNHLAHDLGGGFGMFAFVDNSEWRTVLVTIESDDGRSWTFDLEAQGQEVGLSAREVQRVRGMPSTRSLERTADLLGSFAWYPTADEVGLTTAVLDGVEPVGVVGISLRVLGLDYDRATNEVRRIVLTQWPDAE